MAKRSNNYQVADVVEVVHLDSSSSSDEESDDDFDTMGVDFATSLITPPATVPQSTSSNSSGVMMTPACMFLATTSQPIASRLAAERVIPPTNTGKVKYTTTQPLSCKS